MPAEKFDHPFARIAPAWTWERNKTWGLPTFYALVAWLSDMQWTENGQVSMLELAIDFELFSGLSMPLHGNAPKGVRERGNVLRCMMSALDKLAAQQGLGSCMRGERVCPTTSLSFMGITGISGIRPRPRFREAHTGTILEEQVKGSDVGTQCPTYPDWTIGRAARWALPAPPQLHPDPVHMPGVGIEKALVTCATHHKGKCEACRALVRRDVPTVEMCCRHHHHANDGQPIAVCTEHSTTKCGECKTAAACCRSGHHAWQRNLPRVQKAPYADAEATGGMLQPRPPPVQQAERPVNPRTQQEEEALLTHPGGCTAGDAIRKASGASGASAARGNEKGDGGNRTGDQEAATNARNQRTTSAEEEGAWHPEGRPDRRPQAEEDEGDHPRLRGASKEEEGSEGKQLSETTGDHGHANALESEKRAHVPALVLADSVSGIARKPNPASSTNARP
ncbi:hypothetical protein DIPPA_07155 [Diplonema papillatum]|nr:hypothetical protein DIPPA_07155 [Diplonema papillatum]